jgi:transcriptional regulator with XRE-family HTH domain
MIIGKIKGIPKLTPDQCIIARKALNWTISRLSDETGISENELINYEAGIHELNTNKYHRVIHAFGFAGVRFINGEAANFH